MRPSFYDRTALWWGAARIGQRDRQRAGELHRRAGRPVNVLELGAGFGGTAAAVADLGHDVLGVDLSPVRVAIARRLGQLGPPDRPGRLTVLRADFLDFRAERRFEVVSYWSGFGVGPDADHLALLRRLPDWLTSDGFALIDVFDPAWWRSRRGTGRSGHWYGQRLDYDDATSRLVDERWPVDRPAERVREEIRCYDRAEFTSLVETAGLRLTGFEPSIGTPPGEPSLSYLAALRVGGVGVR